MGFVCRRCVEGGASRVDERVQSFTRNVMGGMRDSSASPLSESYFIFVAFCTVFVSYSEYLFLFSCPMLVGALELLLYVLTDLFLPPAYHVSEWQPRILLGMAEARSIVVNNVFVYF